MRRIYLTICLHMFALGLVTGQYNIELEPWVSGISIPTAITHAGDERLFVAEKGGRVRIVQPDGTLEPDAFLDIRDRVRSSGSEQGLLGLAFHPEYAINGYCYVNYTRNDGATVVSRFTRTPGDPTTASPASELILLVIPQPFTNHNGGDMHFGPDGYLYISTGDGGSGGDPQDNGQERMTLLGKMLRIDVNSGPPYGIPGDNPFVNDPNTLDEIWALGLRNPWRFSFDRLTGDMWIGDVGQGAWEEIDREPAGSRGGLNYGWRCFEGNVPFNTSGCGDPSEYTFPVHVYPNSRFGSGCSVTGGYVYRGTKYQAMYGDYLYTDFCSGKFWVLTRQADSSYVNREVGDFQANEFGALGEDINGELYAAALSSGRIFRIGLPCRLEYAFAKTDQECPDTADGSAEVNVSAQTGSVSFVWSTGDTSAVVDSLLPGKYYVTIQDGSCTLIDSVEIVESALERCDIGQSDLTICDGETLLLEGCPPPPGYQGQWFRNGVPVSASGDTISVMEGGTYTYGYAGECQVEGVGSWEVSLIRLEKPDIRVMDSIARIYLVGPSGFARYIWRLPDLMTEETDVPYLLPQRDGFFSLQVVDTNGCISPISDSLFIMLGRSVSHLAGELLVYPNPTDQQIYVDIPELFSQCEISLWSLGGRLLKQYDQLTGENPMEFDVSWLPAGTYYISLKMKDSVWLGKFAIQ